MASPVAAENDIPLTVDNSRLIYSADEKLNFDLEDYLRTTAPALLPYREAISHWSAYHTISPRVTLALIELQSAALTDPTGTPRALDRPLGDLTTESGFSPALGQGLARLAEQFYAEPDGRRSATEAVRELLGSPARLAELGSVYAELFPQLPSLDEPLFSVTQTEKALPPPDLLQLPYGVGRSWFFGGTHTFRGDNVGPKSSLDLARSWVPWGSDTNHDWVVAAHGGTAVVYSSCYVEVLGPGGWSTSYYHLDNVVVAHGQTVTRDQHLANYADNLPQAICNGGHSVQPHVHFSLLRNGAYVSLADVALSGWVVHPGRFDYDPECEFFWLERDGVRACTGTRLSNPGVGSTPPEPPVPMAPTGLVATPLSSSEVQLAWTDNSSDESGFDVQRRRSGPFVTIATLGADATGHADSGLAAATTYRYRVRAGNAAGPSSFSNTAIATTADAVLEPCVADATTLCVHDGRFRVEASWRDFAERAGAASVVPTPASDSGLFWFFDADNWELLVKIIDGCDFNDRFWVYAAGVTNVEYTLRVTDTWSGLSTAYSNPLGQRSPAVTDSSAFASCSSEAPSP